MDTVTFVPFVRARNVAEVANARAPHFDECFFLQWCNADKIDMLKLCSVCLCVTVCCSESSSSDFPLIISSMSSQSLRTPASHYVDPGLRRTSCRGIGSGYTRSLQFYFQRANTPLL